MLLYNTIVLLYIVFRALVFKYSKGTVLTFIFLLFFVGGNRMNKIYKTVWSKVRNCYVVVSELAKSRTKAPSYGGISRTVVAGVLASIISCGAVMPVSFASTTPPAGSNYVLYYDSDASSIMLEGALGTGTIIDNLADGEISAASKQAVNGSQLYALDQSISSISSSLTANNTAIARAQTDINNIKITNTNLQSTVNTLNTQVSTGFNVTVGGAKVKAVTPSSNFINFVAGDGVSLINDNNSVKIGLSSDGAVAANNTGAITGGTAFTELRPTDGNYVLQANTTAANLGALDTQLKTVTDGLATEVTNRTTADTDLSNRIGTVASDGNYIKASTSKNVAENLVLIDTQVKVNADAVAQEVTDRGTAITNEATARQDADTALGNRIDALDGNTVQYDDATKATVTLEGTNGTTLDNVVAGTLSADSMEAVNGSQLYTTNQSLATEISDRQTAVTNEATARSNADTALSDRIGSVATDGNYIKASTSKNIAENLGLIDTQVKANTDAITQEIADRGTAIMVEATARQNADAALSDRIGTLDANGNYILTTNSATQNISALDTQLKITTDNLATEITNRQQAVTDEGIARFTADAALQNAIDALEGTAVVYDSADTKNKVTLEGTGGTTIDNVKDATLSATSHEAVTGNQLFTTNTNLAIEVTNRTDADVALGNRIGVVAADGNYIKASDTYNISQNLSAIDTQVKANADAINANRTRYFGVNAHFETWTDENAETLKEKYGVQTQAEYENLIATGFNIYGDGAQSDNTIAIGGNAHATSSFSVAIGTDVGAAYDNAVAIGHNVSTDGVAIGTDIKEYGYGGEFPGIAIGRTLESSGANGITMGREINNFSNDGVAIGNFLTVGSASNAYDDNAIAIGSNNTADGSSIVIGNHSVAQTSGTVLGANSYANAGGIAIGSEASAGVSGSYSEYSIAIGPNSKASNDSDVAIGAYTDVQSGTGVGASATASDGGSAFGAYTVSSGSQSTAIGASASATASYATALGSSASASGENSIALGYGSVANTANVLSLGKDAVGTEGQTGYKPEVTRRIQHVTAGLNDTDAVNMQQLNDSITRYFRVNAQFEEWTDENADVLKEKYNVTTKEEYDALIANGLNMYGDGAVGSNSVAVGVSAKSLGTDSIALGHNAQANAENSISIGKGNIVNGANSGAIGDPSVIDGINSYSIGNNNIIAQNTSDVFVLGNNVNATNSNTVILGSNSTATVDNVVSVGREEIKNGDEVTQTAIKRRIINVADGINSSDVATVGQLQDSQIHYVNTGGGWEEWDDENAERLMKTFRVNSREAYETMVANNPNFNVVDDLAMGAIVIGKASSASQDGIAIGTHAVAPSGDGIAIGTNAREYGGEFPAIAIGAQSYSTGGYSVTLGYNNSNSSDDGVVIGSFSEATLPWGIVIGNDSRNYGWNSTAIGRQVQIADQTEFNIAIGDKSSVAANSDYNIVVGANAKAKYDSSIVIGRDAQSESDESIVLGKGAVSSDPGSIVIGTNAHSIASSGVAISEGATVNSPSGIAIGYGATAGDPDVYGEGNIAIGYGTSTSNDLAIAVGDSAHAHGYNAVALGTGANVTGGSSVAVGTSPAVTGSHSYAFGAGTLYGDYSTVAGDNYLQNADYSVVLGQENTIRAATYGDTVSDAVLIGHKNYTQYNNSVAIGTDAVASGENVVSFGHKTGDVYRESYGNDKTYTNDKFMRLTNVADGIDDHDVVNVKQLNDAKTRYIGVNAQFEEWTDSNAETLKSKYNVNSQEEYVALIDSGLNAHGTGASGANSVALGPDVRATGANSVAIGHDTEAAANSVAIGKEAYAYAPVSVALGSANAVYSEMSTAVGFGNDITSETSESSHAFGSSNVINGSNNLALGNENVINGSSNVALGMSNDIQGTSNYAVGSSNVIGSSVSGSLVLGSDSSAVASNAVAIGNNSVASEENSISLGHKATDLDADGNEYGTALTRKITNLADGVDDTDAVTMKQYNALSDTVTSNKTHFFGVNSTNEYDMNYNGGGAEGSNAVAVGSNAWAGGDNSIAIGTMSGTYTGKQATAVGYISSAIADKATAVGNQAQAVNASTVAVGDMAAASGQYSTAIGAYSHAKAKNSIAIGSDSYAETEDEVSFGRAAIEANPEIGQAAHAEIKRRLTHVDTAVNDTDAVNLKQVTDIADTKANIGLDNLSTDGQNVIRELSKGSVKVVNGTYTTVTEGTDGDFKTYAVNVTANGTVANNDTGLVTGGTVYNETRISDAGNYIGADKTAAENLMLLDTQVKANADSIVSNKTHFLGVNSTNAYDMNYDGGGAIGANAIALGTGAWADSDNSIAIGHTSATMFAENAIAIGNLATALEENAVAVGPSAQAPNKFGTAVGSRAVASGWSSTAIGKNAYANGKNSIAVGSDSTALGEDEFSIGRAAIEANAEQGIEAQPEVRRRITHAADGVDASDVSTMNQLWTERDARIEMDSALSGRIGTLTNNGNYIRVDKSLAENIALLDMQMNSATGTLGNAVLYDAADKSLVTLGGTNGTKLTNLKAATLSATSKDAVIGSQLYQTNQNISGFATDINRNKENIRELNTSVTAALESVSSSSLLVDTINTLKADASLNNLTAAGRQIIATAAANAVQEYMAANGGNSSNATPPMAPMMMSSTSNTLNVTDAGNGSLHVGEGSYVNGTSSIAIGVGNQVNANNSGAFGDPSVINADESYVLGNDDTINTGATGSFLIGNDSVSDAKGGLSLGSNNKLESSASDSLLLGNNATASGKNSVALGSGSVVTEDNTVSLGNDTLKRKITNMMDGSIAQDSSDAVTGGQLYITNEKVTKLEDTMKTKAETDASNIDVDAWAQKLGTGKVEAGNDALVTGGAVYNAIDTYASANSVSSYDEANNQLRIGASSKYNGVDSVNIAKLDGSARVMTGVATNPEDPTSAANVAYVDAVGQNLANSVNNRFVKVDDKVSKVGASAAAMASLATPPMDGDEKWAFSAAVGHYDGKTAGAVGAFFRPQDNLIFNVRGAAGNGEDMIGAGVGISLNRGNTPGVSKAQLVRTVNAQAGRIQQLEARDAARDNQINEMRQQMEMMVQTIQDLKSKVKE